MVKGKLNISFLLVWLYLVGGIGSTFMGSYYDIQYFLLSQSKWYILDLFIDFLGAIGLFVALVISMKKTSDTIKIFLYRVFVALGLIGASTLIILRFYFHMAIPSFPPKLLIGTLIVDGTIIKMVLDKKIEPLRT